MPRYIDGSFSTKRTCIDCHILLSRGNNSVRCKKDAGLFRRGKRTSRWLGEKPKCIDCGKELSAYSAYRCQQCAPKITNRTEQMKLSRKITALKNWKDPSIRKNRIDGLHKVSEESQQNRIRKVLKACLVKPNRQEIVLDRIIQQVVPNIYTYVGNAKIFIGRFNPDFIDNSHTKIIELFGDYWHKKSEVIERDNRRLATYKNRGYNALIIWEHELKNVKEVTLKIKQFTEYIGGTK